MAINSKLSLVILGNPDIVLDDLYIVGQFTLDSYREIFWGHMIKGVRVGGRVRVQKVGTKGAKKTRKKDF